jgi:two-component system, NarL family, nitrate/nitrite response regulator NarL
VPIKRQHVKILPAGKMVFHRNKNIVSIPYSFVATQSPLQYFTTCGSKSTKEELIVMSAEVSRTNLHQNGSSQEQPSPTTIWLVDDNEQYCIVFKAATGSSSDIRCTQTFDDGNVMLESLLSEPEWPHIILLDINMPAINGLKLLPQIKAVAPNLPVIMLTVNEQDESIRNAIDLGANGYLLKTSSLTEITRAIKYALQGGVPMDPVVIRKMLAMFTMEPASLNHYTLTTQEQHILELMVEGKTTPEVAETLCLSRHTIVAHLKNIYLKLDVHTRHELVAKVLKEKIL